MSYLTSVDQLLEAAQAYSLLDQGKIAGRALIDISEWRMEKGWTFEPYQSSQLDEFSSLFWCFKRSCSQKRRHSECVLSRLQFEKGLGWAGVALIQRQLVQRLQPWFKISEGNWSELDLFGGQPVAMILYSGISVF